jgi:nucleotide-binding universal stress UspA family protein
MFQQILIAWDGSATAEWAFDVAVDLARRYDADLCAASVAHSPAHAETEGDRAESVDAARSCLEEPFADVPDRAERAGVRVEQAIIEGDDPASAILEYAHAHGIDLIVVGHHRSKRTGRFLIHGLADRTINTSDVPVLVVANGRTAKA